MADITEANLHLLSVPASVQLQILSELKLQTMILAEMHGWTDKLTDLRKDINLLSE